MKNFTVTLSRPFDDSVETDLKEAGVVCRYSTKLNPYLVFAEAKNVQVLEDLEFVVEARESGTFSLYV